MILYLFDVLLFCYMIGNGACEKSRRYATPSFGLPEQKVALHVGVHFYIDKELMVIVVLLFSYHCFICTAIMSGLGKMSSMCEIIKNVLIGRRKNLYCHLINFVYFS